MTLVPFAKPADLQILSPNTTDEVATLVCDLVSAGIRASIGWDVDQTTATYTALVPRNNRRTPTAIWSVVLPALNLTAVTVTVDDAVVDPSGYDWTPHGTISLAYPATQKVVVTYTAGYARTPADQAPPVFRACATDYALQLAGNPLGLKAYSLGAASETFTTDTARAYADTDHRLDAYRVNNNL